MSPQCRGALPLPKPHPTGRPNSIVRPAILLLFGGTLAAQQPSCAPPRSRAADDERLVAAEMPRQRIPGLAVGIVHSGQVVARGYGLANVEHTVPVTDAPIFQSGSLGKMFTAAAIMLQVEDGKLRLDD